MQHTHQVYIVLDMSIGEINPSAVKIEKLISRLAEGDIKIPAFQRHFIWKQGQVIDLLDSIYRDYPIGSILLWESSEQLKATRNICGFCLPERPVSYPINYVLDGQQRLSTIYAVFCKDRTQEQNDDDNSDLEEFDVDFNLDSQKFQARADAVTGSNLFPLKSLLDISSLLVALEKIPNTYHEIIKKLHAQFNNYEIPIVTITKREKTDVGIVFERINNTGTKLTTLDLMIAWTWSEDFLLKEKIKDLLDVLNDKGFGDLPEKIILQCLSAILQKKTSTRAILSLEPKLVSEKFDVLTESLQKAIDFLATQLKASEDFLPHVQQIIPLTYFFSCVNSPTGDQAKWLKQWFWKTSFSRRYAGQTDDKMDADIAFFDQLLEGKSEGLSKYNYSVTEEQLIRQKFSKSSPLVRAFLLLLGQHNPMDLVNGTTVDLGKALSEYNSKEFHHIFPRAFLSKLEVPVDKINSLCNFCFLSADSNKKISSKSPSEYFANLVPTQRRSELLESNLMPSKADVYTKNLFEEFLRLRSQKVLEFLNKQLI